MERFSYFLSIILFSILIAGCSDAGVNDTAELDNSFFETAAEIQFSTVSDSIITISQSQSGSYTFSDKTNLVINEQAAFEAFWKDLHSNKSLPPELPDVDFSEYTVIAAMMGVQPTGGFSIEISKISRGDNVTGVKIEEREPGASCGTFQALTAPFHVVKIPKANDTDIRFVTNRTAVDCE